MLTWVNLCQLMAACQPTQFCGPLLSRSFHRTSFHVSFSLATDSLIFHFKMFNMLWIVNLIFSLPMAKPKQAICSLYFTDALNPQSASQLLNSSNVGLSLDSFIVYQSLFSIIQYVSLPESIALLIQEVYCLPFKRKESPHIVSRESNSLNFFNPFDSSYIASVCYTSRTNHITQVTKFVNALHGFISNMNTFKHL